MGFNKNIRASVKRLANEKQQNLSEQKIYTSREMLDYLQGIGETLMGGAVYAPHVHIYGAGRDGFTAFTDGNDITLNYQHELIARQSTAEGRFITFMGMFFHELAHMRFMDFDESHRAADSVSNGALYGSIPGDLTPEETLTLAEIEDALTKPELIPIFSKCYADMDNIIADRHDETRLMERYCGLVTQGILRVQESLKSDFTAMELVEENLQKEDNSAAKLSEAYNALLQYVRYDEILTFTDEIWETSEILQWISATSKYSEAAVNTDNPQVKYSNINRLLISLWPFIKAVLETQSTRPPEKSESDEQEDADNPSQDTQPQTDEGSGNTSSAPQQDAGNGSSGQYTQESIQSVLDQLTQGSQKAGQSATPQNRSSSAEAVNARTNTGNGQDSFAPSDSSMESSTDILEHAFDRITNSIAEEEAEEEVAEQLNEELEERILTADRSSSHRYFPVRYEKANASRGDIATYDTIMGKIASYSKRLQKAVRDALKDIKEGGIQKHRPYGRIVCVNDAYRPDSKFYANKKQPQDLPDMAVCVLVDNSGSMYGDNIDSAKEAAILLYDFATGLDIPVAVYGHTTDDFDVVFTAFTDFERANDKDKYNIASMCARECNRDGAAIELAASQLAKRPEEIRLLIVISDGQPNHYDYGGESAVKDIQSIIRKYKGLGIEIIGAAIDEDKDVIKQIYGDGYINITDLSKLPKTMVSIVRKRIQQSII